MTSEEGERQAASKLGDDSRLSADESLIAGQADAPARAQDNKLPVDQLTENLSPEELRKLAAKLLKIADSIDQDWRPDNVRSVFKWPSAAYRIERNALELAKRAKLILSLREYRVAYLPTDLLGDTTWEMLLELFCQFAGGAAISIKSLTIASGAAPTTALRQIEKLERAGFITRRVSASDGRVVLVELTSLGVVTVGRVLEKVP